MLLLPLMRLTLFLLLVSFRCVRTLSLHPLACYLPGYECCAEPYINFDADNLKKSLETRLFGQHLVLSVLIKSLKSHLKNKDPPQPLIFLFHGGSGTGKTYVSRMILNTTFRNGINSHFVRTFYFGNTFPNTIKETELVELTHFQIWSLAKTCEYSMFVFDGYFPIWTKILKALRLKDETIYRKTVFIFIFDIASDSLNNYVLQEHHNGRKREDLTSTELLNVVKAPLDVATGLLFKHLSWDQVVYIPFLPLTKAHLMQCIQWELEQQKSSATRFSEEIAEIISKVDKEFVTSGCKRVHEKTLYILGQKHDREKADYIFEQDDEL